MPDPLLPLLATIGRLDREATPGWQEGAGSCEIAAMIDSEHDDDCPEDCDGRHLLTIFEGLRDYERGFAVDSQFAIRARSTLAPLASMLRVAVEALEVVSRKRCGCGHRGDCSACRARAALATIRRMAKEAERVAYDRMTHILALTSEAETRRRDLEQARADYAACAAAIGVEYVQDMGPSYPGPVEAAVRHIEEARRDAEALIDVRNDLEQARAALASVEAKARAKARQSSEHRDASTTEHDRTVHSAQALALWGFAEEIAALTDPARLDADRAEKRAKCGSDRVITILVRSNGEVRGDLDDEHALWPIGTESTAESTTIDGQARSVLEQALARIIRADLGACAPAPSAADEEKPKRWGVWCLDATSPGWLWRDGTHRWEGTEEEARAKAADCAASWTGPSKRYEARELPADAEAGKEMNRG